MFTLELKIFDVVLNAWLQKKWHAQNITGFFLSSKEQPIKVNTNY